MRCGEGASGAASPDKATDMAIDQATVRKIASLARIAITDDEAAAMEGELNGILGWVEQLGEVDVTGVEPMTAVIPNVEVPPASITVTSSAGGRDTQPVMYAGAAIGRTGPLERDTRGIAVSARIAEPWVAPVILAPAVFDALRYYRPESKIARWGSRASKVGALLLAFRPRS